MLGHFIEMLQHTRVGIYPNATLVKCVVIIANASNEKIFLLATTAPESTRAIARIPGQINAASRLRPIRTPD